MIETGENMDHLQQDEDVYDPHDEKEPDQQDEQASLSHEKMKQLSLNKKSWFNQDIFKEINLSIDEQYNKNKDLKQKEKDVQIKKETKILNKAKGITKINNDIKAKEQMDEDSEYEDVDSDEDEDDH